jgi:hypothetical protein
MALTVVVVVAFSLAITIIQEFFHYREGLQGW